MVHFISPQTIRFEIFPFSPSLGAHPIAHIALPYTPHSMPRVAGPWSLDKVKLRLRQEQVEREREASTRYRQQEARRAKEATVGGTTLSRCVLVVLVLCVVLLSVVVLALCATIWSLVQKQNEER